MSNIVADSLPMSLLFTRREVKKGHLEPFFWSEWERTNAQDIIDLMLPKKVPDDTEKIISYLESQLLGLYKKARSREDTFLNKIGVDIKTLTLPDSISSVDNLQYLIDFNREITNLIYKKGDLLRQLFQDIDYATFLAHSPNMFSLTKASENADKQGIKSSKNIAAYDLTNLFLTEQGKEKVKLNISKTEGKKNLVLRDIFNKDGSINKNWIKQLENFYNHYVGPGIGSAIINSPECILIIQDSLTDIMGELLEKMFEGGSIREASFGAHHVGKGISKEVESALKTVFKKLSALFINSGTIPMLFGETYGGLTLTKEIGEGFYDIKINTKLYSYGLLTNELMLSVLIDSLRESIDLYVKRGSKYNKLTLLKQFDKNTEKIKSIIIKDLVGQEVERTAKGVRKILAKWGYALTRGILGEIAAAVAISDNIANSITSISGSNETEAGEVSMDVVAIINGSKFGFQVKNFKNLNVTGFYATDFSVSKENVMRKYFGDFTEGYYWLFANEEMLLLEGLIDNFKERIEYSFYDFTDNFLRISAGDNPDFSYSDAFFIGDKVIPSSYMYYQLIKTIKNAKKNKKRFELQPETALNQAPELQAGLEFSPSLVPNLVNGMNARIEFKGINFNFNNI